MEKVIHKKLVDFLLITAYANGEVWITSPLRQIGRQHFDNRTNKKNLVGKTARVSIGENRAVARLNRLQGALNPEGDK